MQESGSGVPAIRSLLGNATGNASFEQISNIDDLIAHFDKLDVCTALTCVALIAAAAGTSGGGAGQPSVPASSFRRAQHRCGGAPVALALHSPPRRLSDRPCGLDVIRHRTAPGLVRRVTVVQQVAWRARAILALHAGAADNMCCACSQHIGDVTRAGQLSLTLPEAVERRRLSRADPDAANADAAHCIRE